MKCRFDVASNANCFWKILVVVDGWAVPEKRRTDVNVHRSTCNAMNASDEDLELHNSLLLERG